MYLYTLPGLPEQVDIGQAIALDWQAIGLKPKLVEIDFPGCENSTGRKPSTVRLFPGRNALRALDFIRIFNKSKDGVVNSFEHPFIDERLEALEQGSGPGRTGASAARNRRL